MGWTWVAVRGFLRVESSWIIAIALELIAEHPRI